MRHEALLAALIMVVLGTCQFGCRKAPDAVDQFGKTAQLLERYLGTNALDAESAMLDLEKYIRECEKAGSQGLDFDHQYAAVYSRLYLVEKALGKADSAEKYYGKAAQRWQKVYEKTRMPALTREKMREQIEGVNKHLPEPQWETQR